MSSARTTYDPIAMTLHWLMAIAIIALLLIGWTMTGDSIDSSTRETFFVWHKSMGVVIFFAALFRLFWRSRHEPPPEPASLEAGEIMLAQTTHMLLYAFLILQPLTGWMLSSVMPYKTQFFGFFIIPDLFFMPSYDTAVGTWLSSFLKNLHGFLGSAFAILLVVHIGAALKHHFLTRDAVLFRMAPVWAAPLLKKLRHEK
jgi:cytochrome b561